MFNIIEVRTMKPTRRFFKITSDLSRNFYLCREGSYDMYRVTGFGVHHVELTGPADIDKAEEAGYRTAVVGEEELWPHKLWKGSFMRSKGKRK
jgi:hypothetical protein